MTGENELSAADAAHRAWLADVYAKAAATADATLDGALVFGWRDRSAGARVATAAGPRWLRLVIEQHGWAGGAFWTGNADANDVTGVAKPWVLRHWDLTDGDWAVRAELMTLMPGARCSPTPELREPLAVAPAWWEALWSSLAAVAATATTRIALGQDDLSRRVEMFFGDRAGDTTVNTWTAAHGDLHWANLLQPECALLDWEGWGTAPAGYDAACLYVHTLLVPAAAAAVRAELGLLLDTRDGLLAQLYATTRMLMRVDQGDYPGMAIPLHRNAEQVLARLTSA
ncbi:aminoglycoside phosphotransferase [Alloactinosynnema sp. L-07]|uniref:aminoglycoside phosphotransferase n=1 Tax=Alloactinosynnema sp. L-07 TaxID=1653480 RepID=UPI0008305DC9|nr:aminoglycoside phosphotransferase [Alloactinosynnema sp. L-07]